MHLTLSLMEALLLSAAMDRAEEQFTSTIMKRTWKSIYHININMVLTLFSPKEIG